MKRKKYKFKFYPNVPKMVLNWLGDRGIQVDTTCSCCQQPIKIKCCNPIPDNWKMVVY